MGSAAAPIKVTGARGRRIRLSLARAAGRDHLDWDACRHERPTLAPLLFGEQCAPIRLVQSAADADPVWREVEQLLDLLRTRPFRTLAEKPSYEDQCQHLANGILDVLCTACRWFRQRSLDAGLFLRAVAAFDQAWPGMEFRLGPLALPPDSDLAQHVHGICGEEPKQGGFWVAWDLLDRLVHWPRRSYPQQKIRQAHTPVLLAGTNRSGTVAMLTVELIQDGNSGFCPDPLYTGLTCLSNSTDHLRNLQRSMQRVWQRSGVEGNGYRGLWRVTRYDPDATVHARDPLDYRCLEGRSLEAATMAALWATYGGAPGEIAAGGGPLLELDRRVAITARLADEDDRPAGDGTIALRSTDFVPRKLKAARHAELDTVLVAETEPASAVQDDSDRERQPLEGDLTAGTRPEYPGLQIERVATMGAAFEQLLVQNRFLRIYQQNVRDEWLALWAPGTARAPGEDGPKAETEDTKFAVDPTSISSCRVQSTTFRSRSRTLAVGRALLPVVSMSRRFNEPSFQ